MFTAGGKVLFVNMQKPGLTLAITDPWEKYLRRRTSSGSSGLLLQRLAERVDVNPDLQ